MATEIEHIKKMLLHNQAGPMWYGTSIGDILKGITWQQAFSKPTGFTHNIYEYVCHMHTWRKFVVEFLNGNTAYCVEIDSEQDWTKNYDATEENWSKALAELNAAHGQLLASIDQITNQQLDELVPGKKFKWYAFLHGVLHHDIYHSAEISILKKFTA